MASPRVPVGGADDDGDRARIVLHEHGTGDAHGGSHHGHTGHQRPDAHATVS